MGSIFLRLALAYALFEIPTGWLGDKIGARSVLLRVVLWWSFFTAATGWAWNYVSMLVTRFLFGAGEAGCFPNLTKALSTWLPVRDRTRAQALMWMGARWGGAAAPLLVVIVIAFVNWRTAFLVFAFSAWHGRLSFGGGTGTTRATTRASTLPNSNCSRRTSTTSPATATSRGASWRLLPSMWLLWVQYFCLSYGWYFFVTWLPDYLNTSGRPILSNEFLN